MKTVIAIVAGGAIAIGCVGLVSIGATNYLRANTETKPVTTHCYGSFPRHVVEIRNGVVSPHEVIAKECDTLEIVNADDRIRLIAFGEHAHHQAYDGETEQALSQGQNMTVTLNQLGLFTFHDHLQESVVGYFTVVPR